MLGHLLHSRPAPGAKPGMLVDPPIEQRIGSLTIYRVDFGADIPPEERCETDFDRVLIAPESDQYRLTWLHFEGDVSAAQLKQLGNQFSLHPLALEDVLNQRQRPKLDAYRATLFATLSLPYMADEEFRFQQVSVFIGERFVLSFHAGQHDVFAPVRERIHDPRNRIANGASDFLGYCLADVVVDSSFDLLSAYHDRLEALEDRIFEDRTDDLIGVIHDLRRRLIGIRKVFLAQNELLVRWVAIDHALIHNDNRVYFRDAQDHAKRVVDLADGYYETAQSLLNTHLSIASARLNDVMRVLTLIATIFMPLSFLAGIYGMNFNTKYPWNLPELSFAYGYPVLLGAMVIIVLGMFYYFRRKGWI